MGFTGSVRLVLSRDVTTAVRVGEKPAIHKEKAVVFRIFTEKRFYPGDPREIHEKMPTNHPR